MRGVHTSGDDLLADAFGRIRGVVHAAVEGLKPDELAFRPDPRANSIAWLVWHLTRIQDDHIADLADSDQVWLTAGWADRFALPFNPTSTGFGHTPEDVAAVQVEAADLLVGYHDAVHDRTVDYVCGLEEVDLARVVDRSWDPPVTVGVRLVSVISDGLQHAGQAAFLRGTVERRASGT